MILVVLENQRGNIHAFSQEAVAAGQQLSTKLGLDLCILCLGENASALKEQASNYKVKNLILAQNDLIGSYSADGYSKALAKSLSVTSGSVIHICARSLIQNGNAIFPVSSMINCVEDLSPKYSSSSTYVPGFHIVASKGNFDGNSVYSWKIGCCKSKLLLSVGSMM